MTDAKERPSALKAAIAAIAILCAAAALAVFSTAAPAGGGRATNAATTADSLDQRPLGR